MPPGPSLLQQVGAQPSQPSRGAPLFHNRFFTGLWTQRNALRDPSGVVTERWYGGRTDALLDGLNVELTNRLTLARAPGSSKFSTATFSSQVDSFYAFKQFSTSSETISVIADTPANVYILNPTSKNSILTKGAGAGPAYFVGVGNVLYIGDGVDQKAYSAIGGIRNWGIAIASGAGTASAYAGTAANVTPDPWGGTVPWLNPTNAEGAPDGNYATTALGAGPATSEQLYVSNYSFSVAAGLQIVGITVVITLESTVGGLLYLALTDGNSYYGVKQFGMNPGGGTQTVTLGGPADNWGVPLTGAIVSGSGFGLAINAILASGTIGIDAVQITINYSAAPAVSLVSSGGFNPAPSTGYKYVVMYGINGQVFSAASPPSSLEKPSNSQSVQIALVASTNPAVNQIWVLRTADGGSTYYNLPTSPYPNTTQDVLDDAPDTALNTFQQADLTGLNTPPPSGLIGAAWYQGRLWGFVGNTLYYSVGPDLGLVLGNASEGWPALNNFVFPSSIVRVVPISIGAAAISMLLVFTTSDVYAIYGNGSALAAATGVSGITVYYAAPLLSRVGLANYWALDVRGSMVYMMTTDGRAISFNPASQIIYTDPEKAINEIGFAIGAAPPGVTLTGGTLAGFTPANSYVTWHGAGSADQALYVADGATGWFRCNTNQQPDGGQVWSTKRNIVGGCQAVQSIETSPGVYQLLIGPTSGGGPVLYRDPTVFTDNGSAYGSGNCFARMAGIVLAQPGQISEPEFITADFVNVGSEPTIGVLYDELDGAFTTLVKTANDPPNLTAPSTVMANRYATRQATTGVQPSPACRWVQFTINFGNDTVQNEILSFSPFGAYEPEH